MKDRFFPTFRNALRHLARNPGLSTVVVLSLALAIGLNTAVFSFANALFLRPLPVSDPARLVAVYSNQEGGGSGRSFSPVSLPNVRDFAESSRSFSGLAAFSFLRATLSGGDEPIQVWGEIVTGNYFDLLGVRAHVGRTILPGEEVPGAHPVVVLGHGLWQRRFAGDPNVVGQKLRLNGHELTIVGVAPEGFRGTSPLYPKELWVSISVAQQVSPFAPLMEQRRVKMFGVVGRLAPGVTVDQAQNDLGRIAAVLASEYPDDNRGTGVRLVPLAQAAIDPNLRDLLALGSVVLTASVILVLAIACVNLANLMLAHALARRGELAIRAALGANRRLLVRQFLAESVLLAVGGGALGILLGAWLAKALWKLRPTFFPPDALDLTIDARVLGFAFLLVLGACLLFGIAPALHAARTEPLSAFRQRGEAGLGRPAALLRNAFVGAQIALSLVALIAAGLFVRSLRNVQQIDPGFQTENIALVPIDPGAEQPSPERARDIYRRVVDRARGLPGVEEVALGERFPLNPAGLARGVLAEGELPRSDGQSDLVRSDTISPEYFRTLGIPLLRGRGFTGADREESPRVAVINETLASRLWPGQEALGRRFRFTNSEDLYEVVGIARNARYLSLNEPPQPFVYLPAAQHYSPAMILYVRTAGDPEKLIPELRNALRALDPSLPLMNIQTGYPGPTVMAEVVEDSRWAQSLLARLLVGFGFLALALTLLGVYGVTAYVSGLRRQEIGIRLALGAEPSALWRLILRQGITQAAWGILLGAVAAFAVARLSSRLLFGLQPADPLTFVVAAALLFLATLVAGFVSVRRSMTIDPMIVLKTG